MYKIFYNIFAEHSQIDLWPLILNAHWCLIIIDHLSHMHAYHILYKIKSINVYIGKSYLKTPHQYSTNPKKYNVSRKQKSLV